MKNRNIDFWSFNREGHEVISFPVYTFIYVSTSELWAAAHHIFSFRTEISKGEKHAKCERNIEYSEESCSLLPSLQRNLSPVLDQCILSWHKHLIRCRLLHLCYTVAFYPIHVLWAGIINFLFYLYSEVLLALVFQTWLCSFSLWYFGQIFSFCLAFLQLSEGPTFRDPQKSSTIFSLCIEIPGELTQG